MAAISRNRNGETASSQTHVQIEIGGDLQDLFGGGPVESLVEDPCITVHGRRLGRHQGPSDRWLPRLEENGGSKPATTDRC
jgi:hypothetical protein